jgi:[ribosomal protein S5]-alanine N-acetyltransferase
MKVIRPNYRKRVAQSNPDNKEVEIGFELMEQYNGKGYMLEAVEAIIEFAKHKMKVERINAIAHINNKNCIKLLEKQRFIKVGEEETEFRGQIYLHYIYALKIQPDLKSYPGG